MATIGYEETCIAMEPGDEALVFRIPIPPSERRIATRGDVGVDFLAEHCEIGLLRRTW